MYKTVQQEVTFNAKPSDVYEALIDAQKHSAFTGAPAESQRAAGGAHSAYGGMVHGFNLELLPNERIVQAWRIKDWADGHFSLLTYRLVPEGNKTRVVMEQLGVPEAAYEHISEGWKAQYWTKLKKYLEN